MNGSSGGLCFLENPYVVLEVTATSVLDDAHTQWHGTYVFRTVEYDIHGSGCRFPSGDDFVLTVRDERLGHSVTQVGQIALFVLAVLELCGSYLTGILDSRCDLSRAHL